MADPSKTEKATPKRRDKARRDGSVARSAEISHTAVLLAALVALVFEAPSILSRAEGIMHDGLARTSDPTVVEHSTGLSSLADWGMRSLLGAVWPILGAAALAGIVAGAGQAGLKFSGKALKPSFKRLNIASGLKQLVSPQKLGDLAKAMVKLLVVGSAAGLTLWSKLPTMGLLVGMAPGSLLAAVSQTVLSIAEPVVAALIVIAIVDYVWQRKQFEKRIRMTKQEVKDEGKEANLPPEVRGKIRQKQAEQARRRMLAAVPTADVVVVNPTHYAVALRYDGSTPAPEVVAKGVDHVARRIREVAEEAGVAIVHEPPLARALYRDVDLDHQIPEELFGAVAEVLAFVFRTAKRHRRRKQVVA